MILTKNETDLKHNVGFKLLEALKFQEFYFQQAVGGFKLINKNIGTIFSFGEI